MNEPVPDEPGRVPVPNSAVRSLARCNLAPRQLASLAFQFSPRPLILDGILPFHKALFRYLDQCAAQSERSELFARYMNAHFLLDKPEENGWHAGQLCDRRKADYRRLIQGWHMDSASREAAVLKAWVASRFGLTTRFHGGTLADADGRSVDAYTTACARGSYNTNALESQLDLLYSYAQYELQRDERYRNGLRLFRGIGDRREVRPLYRRGKAAVLLLNNLSSFAAEKDRADEFGDTLFDAVIPREKILCYDGLLPGVLKSEAEFLVIGGLAFGELTRH